jgi:2-iminobutanoate/2-iminopropanoate deaminase
MSKCRIAVMFNGRNRRMVMPEIITTQDAFCPTADLPISQAMKANGFIFLMGVGAREPGTGRIVGSDIRTQTRKAIENVQAILRAAGADLKDVVRATCYLTRPEDYDGYNETFAEFFRDIRPPRASLFMSGFRAPEMLVELEITAVDPRASR